MSALDIVGGGYADPGDTELDNALELIVADYVPDSLLRLQCTARLLREVVRRTGMDAYARPEASR